MVRFKRVCRALIIILGIIVLITGCGGGGGGGSKGGGGSTSTITGKVTLDGQNKVGVEISLWYGSSGALIKKTVTNNEGVYLFENVSVGNNCYYVTYYDDVINSLLRGPEVNEMRSVRVGETTVIDIINETPPGLPDQNGEE